MKCAAVWLVGLLLGTTALADTTIRVRLKKAVSKIELEGLGVSVALNPRMLTPVGMPQVTKVSIRLVRDAKKIPVWHVRRDGQKTAAKFVGKIIYIEGQTLRLGLTTVPNTLELVAGPTGTVDVVAALDLEKYLTGVLPSEMPASWPFEALKAQVIASRSYAAALSRQRRDQAFHVESSILDQVFDIHNHTGATDSIREKVARAVRETKDQVLIDEMGRVVKAHYHADCGGRTEAARQVWGQSGFETGVVKDALCPLSPLARWQYRLNRTELREQLAIHFGVGPGIALESVSLVGRTQSGRVASVDVIFADRESRRMSSHEFRKALGFHQLRSTNFALHWQADQLIIEGKGHGHGVGMCQYGARQLASRGLDYRQIVATYYPKVKIGTLGRAKGLML